LTTSFALDYSATGLEAYKPRWGILYTFHCVF